MAFQQIFSSIIVELVGGDFIEIIKFSFFIIYSAVDYLHLCTYCTLGLGWRLPGPIEIFDFVGHSSVHQFRMRLGRDNSPGT